jgi:hypothetical protein
MQSAQATLNCAGKLRRCLQKKIRPNIFRKRHSRKPRKSGVVLPTGLGDPDEAFKWLYRARDERFIVIGTLRVDPVYESLRRDERYSALIREIGLEP